METGRRRSAHRDRGRWRVSCEPASLDQGAPGHRYVDVLGIESSMGCPRRSGSQYDSLVEGDGFELPVPREMTTIFEPSCFWFL
jgi:hypothetical protein